MADQFLPRAESLSKFRVNRLLRLDDIMQAIELIGVGFGLFGRSGQLAAWNSLYLEHLSALVPGNGPCSRWQTIAGKLGLCADDVENELPPGNRAGAIFLHSPDGRRFQVSRSGVARSHLIVTSVEIPPVTSDTPPNGTGQPSAPTTGMANRTSGLTRRAEEVVGLLIRGYRMKEVARELGITPRTVAFHKYKVMEANELRTNSDLLRFAIHYGLLGPDLHRPMPTRQVSREGLRPVDKS